MANSKRISSCLLLTMSFVCGSVSTAAAKEPSQSATTQRTTIRINNVNNSKSELSFDYFFTNTSTKAVWVFSSILEQQRNSRLTVNETKAYVEVRDNTLILSKMLVEVPAGLRLESPEIPAMKILPPKKVLRGRVVLNKQNSTAFPYREPKDIPWQKLQAFQLILGTLVSYDGEYQENKDTNGRRYYMPTYGKAVMSQVHVTSASQQL